MANVSRLGSQLNRMSVGEPPAEGRGRSNNPFDVAFDPFPPSDSASSIPAPAPLEAAMTNTHRPCKCLDELNQLRETVGTLSLLVDELRADVAALQRERGGGTGAVAKSDDRPPRQTQPPSETPEEDSTMSETLSFYKGLMESEPDDRNSGSVRAEPTSPFVTKGLVIRPTDDRQADREFHRLFPGAPSDDRVFKVYDCAYRDSFQQRYGGQLYVTWNHLCFFVDQTGWDSWNPFRYIVIPLRNVVSIEETSVPLYPKNGIKFRTNYTDFRGPEFLFVNFTLPTIACNTIKGVWTHNRL